MLIEYAAWSYLVSWQKPPSHKQGATQRADCSDSRLRAGLSTGLLSTPRRGCSQSPSRLPFGMSRVLGSPFSGVVPLGPTQQRCPIYWYFYEVSPPIRLLGTWLLHEPALPRPPAPSGETARGNETYARIAARNQDLQTRAVSFRLPASYLGGGASRVEAARAGQVCKAREGLGPRRNEPGRTVAPAWQPLAAALLTRDARGPPGGRDLVGLRPWSVGFPGIPKGCAGPGIEMDRPFASPAGVHSHA